MSAQINIGDNPATEADHAVRGKLSATVVDPHDVDPHADLVEIRAESGSGAVSTVRLSRDETETLALLLSKIVDDQGRRLGSSSAENLRREGRSITRDALLKALLPLPPEAEIDVQIGTEHIGITGIGPAWDPQQRWFALQCDPADILSLRAFPPA